MHARVHTRVHTWQADDANLELLAQCWPNVKDQMDVLDAKYVDADGVIRVAQQNT